MEFIVASDQNEAAAKAAQYIAELARECVRQRGRFWLAVSGGSTPGLLFDALTQMDLPWLQIHIAQVDERVAPEGSADRNWTQLEQHLLSKITIPAGNLHPMPVTAANLEQAAGEYADRLRDLMGGELAFDLVHLGLGDDGHTASLVPADPVLDQNGRDVAVTAQYQGRRRMTLTFPALNRAQQIVWLVGGAGKAAMLARLREADPSIPAGRVVQTAAVIFADKAAAGLL